MRGRLYTTSFSTKTENFRKLGFARFTPQQRFGGLKMETFENMFQSASFYRYCLHVNYKNTNLGKVFGHAHAHVYYVFSFLTKGHCQLLVWQHYTASFLYIMSNTKNILQFMNTD